MCYCLKSQRTWLCFNVCLTWEFEKMCYCLNSHENVLLSQKPKNLCLTWEFKNTIACNRRKTNNLLFSWGVMIDMTSVWEISQLSSCSVAIPWISELISPLISLLVWNAVWTMTVYFTILYFWNVYTHKMLLCSVMYAANKNIDQMT